jgi:tocopherol O-methyltransferase
VIEPRTPHVDLPARVSRHYGDLDPFYRRIWGEHVHHGLWRRGDETPGEAVTALVEAVVERAGIEAGDRVLDVGSGYGATARHLAREREARVVALTLSAEQHRIALSHPRHPGDPTYLQGDWLEVEVEPGGFDAVIAVESSTHLPDLREGLRRGFRALRPGGRFVACVWLHRPDPAPWEVRHLLEPICREGRLARLTTAREFMDVLHAVGFAEGTMEDLSRRVARTWTLCMGRAVRSLITDAEARRFLLDRSQDERVFARSLLRIRLAYATGSLRYGLISARRPPTLPPPPSSAELPP